MSLNLLRRTRRCCRDRHSAFVQSESSQRPPVGIWRRKSDNRIEVFFVTRKVVLDMWIIYSCMFQFTFAMRVDLRNMITLHAQIIDCIEGESMFCSDGWVGYNRLLRLRVNRRQQYSDHIVVIQEENHLNLPHHRQPFWKVEILQDCLDKQFVGPHPKVCFRLGDTHKR